MNKNIFFELNPSLILSGSDTAVFKERSIVKKVEGSSFFILPGSDSLYLPYVLDGIFKVYKQADNGREITLYRIEEGQSCILSALSILNSTPFPATVESECDSEVLLIPSDLLVYLVENYTGWRNYVFSMYNNRFDILLTLIDELLFHRLDLRLSEFLVKQCSREGYLKMTHQEIADELGSRREVISRILKDFESRGIVKLGRGIIRLTDVSRLPRKGFIM